MKFPAGSLFILLFFLIGFTFVVVAYSLYAANQKLIKEGIATNGLVVAMHRIHRNEYPEAPSIRYFSQDGREHIFHSSIGQNPPEYAVGQEVTIYYDKEDPTNIYLEGSYLMVFVFGGMGIAFLLFSIWEIGGSVKEIFRYFTRAI